GGFLLLPYPAPMAACGKACGHWIFYRLCRSECLFKKPSRAVCRRRICLRIRFTTVAAECLLTLCRQRPANRLNRHLKGRETPLSIGACPVVSAGSVLALVFL